MLILLSFLFVVCILLTLNLERKILKTPSSPLMLVVVSNMSILVLYYFTQDWLGFHPLEFKTVFILLYGCFIFAIVSFLFAYGRKKRNKEIERPQLLYISDTPSRRVIVLSILTILFMFAKISFIGLDNLMEDVDAQAQLGGGGLSGHILVLQILLITHMFGMKTSIKSSPIISALFICLLLYQVKVWILAPLIIGIFLRRDLRGAKLKLWHIVAIPVLIFAIFVGTYSLSLGFEMDNMTFLWAHFCGYVFAGVGGLNEAVSHNLPEGLSPLYGLPTFITIPFDIKVKVYYGFGHLVMNDVTNTWSNVYSLFGGCWYLNGIAAGTIYMLVVAFISYRLYNIRLKSNNYWYYLAYYMWAIGLILSFYGNYYTLLSIYELTVWSFIIGTVKSNNSKKKYASIVQNNDICI